MPTTVQEPLRSGFDAASTAEDVVRGIDLTGKVAVVTGGYSGIGLETARVLRAAGAEVVVPARDTGRAEAALKGIDGVGIEAMDLLDPASVDAFAENFLASGRPLHILVNSAGVMATPLTRDARGYEVQFATNHLGHFQLAARLRPALRRAQGARVVSVSSWGHRFSPVRFDDPHFEHSAYDRWVAYGQSKTANILFAVALDERGRADGIRAYSLHPGSIVDTNLKKYLAEEDLKAAGVHDADGRTVLDPTRQLKTVEQGAATSVWCATSPLLAGKGGVYCENNDIAPPMSAAEGREWTLTTRTPKPGVLAYALDPEAADRLWELSERLTA
ncbi:MULTISPECIES: oxidoreductase [unclassified Streptomyces]|uniref:oxidoreductase n=1 Tax=unclassified Streptomyces TaxID=2593676 RepID=UPI0011CDAA6E|nr:MULTISPECIES: oxidoreductase [unclassified Streptomyces]TXS79112.1 SDR family NAD(P)-dependent oxidoreductase [Streptomyces sp. me109]